MTSQEKLATIRNVISDLEVVLDEVRESDEPIDDDQWFAAQLAAEYITEENPHL